MNNDEHWMQLALSEAAQAAAEGEVPVGAVVVKDGVLVASGRNAPIALHDPSAHAEILALRAAGRALGNYRLEGCQLFVTLEPCAMCAAAILHARLDRVVFGAFDPRTGAAGSVLDLFGEKRLNHRTGVQGNVLAAEAGALLQDFFRRRREIARHLAEPLRADALRTPDAYFDALAEWSAPPHYARDLPSLDGLRLHYIDIGPKDAAVTMLGLHGPGEWSYFFRNLAGLAELSGFRFLAPDLVGFGRSDKPKREDVHRIGWHLRALNEWVDRLQPGPLVLVASPAAGIWADELQRSAPDRYDAILVAPDAGKNAAGDSQDAAWRAPFPDRGHEAALRAFGPIAQNLSGPDLHQAQQLVESARMAMGYSAR
ncbi:tRNA-specific adenosine deaminase [Burkholderiales bacterium 8X]|nr:tRNA-specific adenosine deaminase [Burkholderiales bacterium 8X]